LTPKKYYKQPGFKAQAVEKRIWLTIGQARRIASRGRSNDPISRPEGRRAWKLAKTVFPDHPE
jgi:hypothetical protein